MRMALLAGVGALPLAGLVLLGFAASVEDRDNVALYQRIGGPSGVTKIVDGFLAEIDDDDRLEVRAPESDLNALRGPLSDLLCEATGGPCWYEGNGLLEVRGLPGVSDDLFGILARHFATAMADADVGRYDQFAAMKAYAAMYDVIVGREPRILGDTLDDDHRVSDFGRAQRHPVNLRNAADDRRERWPGLL